MLGWVLLLIEKSTFACVDWYNCFLKQSKLKWAICLLPMYILLNEQHKHMIDTQVHLIDWIKEIRLILPQTHYLKCKTCSVLNLINVQGISFQPFSLMLKLAYKSIQQQKLLQEFQYEELFQEWTSSIF